MRLTNIIVLLALFLAFEVTGAKISSTSVDTDSSFDEDMTQVDQLDEADEADSLEEEDEETDELGAEDDEEEETEAEAEAEEETEMSEEEAEEETELVGVAAHASLATSAGLPGFPYNNKAGEQQWLSQQTPLNPSTLLPGDIILKKMYTPSVVSTSQWLINLREKPTDCSSFTVHAMIYLGNGQIGHASATCNGVVASALISEEIGHGTWQGLVYRPTDTTQANAAVTVMNEMIKLGLKGDRIKYSTKNCLKTLLNAGWSSEAATFAAGAVTLYKEAPSSSPKKPSDAMMCSEAAAFAFQGLTPNTYINMYATRVSPMKLESFLNQNPTKFAYAGMLSMTATQKVLCKK